LETTFFIYLLLASYIICTLKTSRYSVNTDYICESSDFSPISLPYIPILCKLTQFDLVKSQLSYDLYPPLQRISLFPLYKNHISRLSWKLEIFLALYLFVLLSWLVLSFFSVFRAQSVRKKEIFWYCKRVCVCI